MINIDNQTPKKISGIVCEGSIYAIHIEGVALLGSELKDQQALLINRLGKQVIVIPDPDSKGKKLVEQAIDQGWSVSMPEWSMDINDVGDAVDRYGRI